MNEHTKPAIAEFFGTFILVFIGAGAGALAKSTGGGIVSVALAHGFALMVIIYAIGGVSGAHVNPAVTLGVAVAGKISWARAVIYWVAQIVGCIVAAYALKYCLGTRAGNLGSTTLANGIEAIPGLTIEIILTIFLMVAVMVSGVWGKNGNMAGVAIGSVLIMDILMGGSLTGASMNPARTIGPALAWADYPMGQLWIYLVGPAIGAVAGVFIVKAIHTES